MMELLVPVFIIVGLVVLRQVFVAGGGSGGTHSARGKPTRTATVSTAVKATKCQ